MLAAIELSIQIRASRCIMENSAGSRKRLLAPAVEGPTMHTDSHLQHRRRLLKSAACGFGGLAFSGLAARASAADASSSHAAPLFTPRAKRVIFVFMQGGPSHVDTFDYKPELIKRDGEKLAFRNSRK